MDLDDEASVSKTLQQMKNGDVLFDDLTKSTIMKESMDSVDPSKTSSPGHSDNGEDDNGDDDGFIYMDDDDDGYLYGDDDIGDGDEVDDDHYARLQAQFDNVDLPPGVEVSMSWLGGPQSTEKAAAAPSSSSCHGLLGLSGISDVHAKEQVSTSSSTPAGFNANRSDKVEEVVRKYQQFKRFDTVEDFTDHHFGDASIGTGGQPPKSWLKKIQDEWRILEMHLPDTICVRVSEARMDLLRASIVGPAGTPYHDGIFFFDVLFPSSYPLVPPMVYYYSGGLRLNPNLYACGKVCLSLLNTWTGRQTEVWLPEKSTILQVLVSIQALILNENPFFNEPGYEGMYGGVEGERRSTRYNEDTLVLSLKTMLYTIRRPPKHFEDYVAGHFRLRAHDILSACKAYSVGAKVGSVVKGVQDVNDADKIASMSFRASVAKMMNVLITSFIKNGSHDCEQFRVQA